MKKRVGIYLLMALFLGITACAKEDDLMDRLLVPQTQEEISKPEETSKAEEALEEETREEETSTEEASIEPPFAEETIVEETSEKEVFAPQEVSDLYTARWKEHRDNLERYYAFSLLEEANQKLYIEILLILENHEENADVSSLSPEAIDKVFQCVLNDHPEIFYVQGYKYTKFTRDGTITRIAISGTYSMSKEEVLTNLANIEGQAKIYLASIPSGASEYDKVKYVYESIIANTEYNLNAPENQNICSVFLYKESVCQGYAKAMQYLLNKMGVFATLVTGKVDTGEGHAWNLVRIDGAYYYVDATWGDAFYRFDAVAQQTDTESMPSINYDYLCVTTEQLTKTHIIENVVPMPRCVSLEANYYVKEGAYFTNQDEERMQAMFQEAYAAKNNYITFKCSSQEVYDAMLAFLIKEQKVFAYLQNNADSVAYAENKKQLTISFWLS